jgi:hypothetical protein
LESNAYRADFGKSRVVNDRDLVRQLSYARIAVGVSAVLAPGRVNRGWVGPIDGDRPGPKLIARTFGVRDAALGVITLRAIDDGSDRLADLLRIGAVCDTVDAAATIVAFRHLPKLTRFAVLASAAGAAFLGFRAAATD